MWSGDTPWVKDDLTLVLIAVVLVFVAPGLVGVARRRLRGGGRSDAAAVPASASDAEPAGERPEV